MFNRCNPIICPPKHIVRERFVPREVPIIHPVVHVNRTNIVNVPRHIVRPIRVNEVNDPGYPNRRRFW